MKKGSLGLLLIASATCFTTSQMQSYTNYLAAFQDSPYSKLYTLEAYLANVALIREHNLSTFTLDVNALTGLSYDTLQASMSQELSNTCPTEGDLFNSNSPVLESSWDYRISGVSSPVVGQGFQGQGWVHAAVSGIEQNYQIKFTGKKKIELSRQQALDCMNSTILGETTSSVFKYYSTSGGVATEASYPFQPE